MEKNITIGIIGCGMAAHYHIEGLLKISQVNLKWICDKSLEIAKKTGEKYSLSFLTTDYQEIIEDKSVDAIIITTPPSSHFKMAMDSLSAKKHILLEKPITTNRQDLYELCKLAEAHPDLVVLDCSARHSRLQPKFVYFKEMIKSGELGHIYGIHHNAVNRVSRPGIEYHPEAKWFLEKKKSGGGPLIDWGVYDLSFHLGLLNDRPSLVDIKSFNINGLDNFSKDNNNFDVEEHGIVMMNFDTELAYYWERASNAHNEASNETRLYGTKGGLKFSYLSWESEKAEYYFLDGKGKPKKTIIDVDMKNHLTPQEDFYKMDLHFIECILKKTSPILPFFLSVKHMDIIFSSLSKPIYRG